MAASGVRPGDLVLDIGAGRGALTAHLVAAGARVVAVELHAGRAAYMRERFADDDVRVVHGDVLEMPWPHRAFRVVASPPYGISSPLLRRLLAPGSRLVAADLVLQRAVVRRYAESRPGVGRQWDVRQGLALPRRAFRPPPHTDSAVLRVRRAGARTR